MQPLHFSGLAQATRNEFSVTANGAEGQSTEDS
jgi:hypothetical protein